MPVSLSAHDRRRVSVEAVLCAETVSKAYKGLPVRRSTSERIARAAHALGLTPPPGVTLTIPGTPGTGAPIPMLLWCPSCHTQHIDRGKWRTRPHARHLCNGCGVEWTPCRLATVGVKELP